MGLSRGVGGAEGLEGAFRWQWEQVSRMLLMSLEMPGQKTEDSALKVMEVVPWCAAWRVERTSFLRDGGITMRSLYRMIPSDVERFFLN